MTQDQILAVDGLPPLREVMVTWGLNAKKSLGQHFLCDLNLTARIARAAGDLRSGTVIEIGPGPGGLTRAMLHEGAKALIVLEKDHRAIKALEQIKAHYPEHLQIIEADALKTDISQLGEAPRRIVANLPYNISTALLLRWLKQANSFTNMTLMFQKEVAQRLVAPCGSPAYGRLSVMVQFLCTAKILFHIDARAFTPPPKVTSTLVQLTPRPKPLADIKPETLEYVTAQAFGQRRKMLRSSLKGLGEVLPMLEAIGIRLDSRAEELSVGQFCQIAWLVENKH